MTTKHRSVGFNHEILRSWSGVLRKAIQRLSKGPSVVGQEFRISRGRCPGQVSDCTGLEVLMPAKKCGSVLARATAPTSDCSICTHRESPQAVAIFHSHIHENSAKLPNARKPSYPARFGMQGYVVGNISVILASRDAWNPDCFLEDVWLLH